MGDGRWFMLSGLPHCITLSINHVIAQASSINHPLSIDEWSDQYILIIHSSSITRYHHCHLLQPGCCFCCLTTGVERRSGLSLRLLEWRDRTGFFNCFDWVVYWSDVLHSDNNFLLHMVPRLLLIKHRFMNPGLALPIEIYFGKQTSLDSHPKGNVIYLWRKQVDKHEKPCFCCDDYGWRLDIEGGCEQDRILQQVLFEHMFC